MYMIYKHTGGVVQNFFFVVKGFTIKNVWLLLI